MRTVRKIWMAVCLYVALGSSGLHAQTYDKLWKQVEQAQQKSLPQTVIKLTDEIFRKGEREQNVGQMLKAYICRESYQQRLTPDSLYSNYRLQITNYKSLLTANASSPTSQKVTRAVLHSLLAEKYAEAMRANRRALQGRTALEVDEAPEDVREWSTNLFVEKIDMHLRASLQDSVALLETSAEEYLPFTILEEGSRYYRHDMYHLLASRAIKLYDNYRLQITNHKECIHTVYDNMIRTYRHRTGAEDAVLLCEIDFLNYKSNQLEYPGTIQELDKLIGEFGSRELCAEVYFKKASLLCDTNKQEEALAVCDEGLKRYPKYSRINELRNLRAEILKPLLHVSIDESGYPGDSIAMRVGYRNISNYKLQITNSKSNRLVSSQTYNLPHSVVYKDTTLYFLAPQETGKHTLRIIPGEPCDDLKDLALPFNSSRFKVLTMELGDGRVEVTTLDAATGWPIANATVNFYSLATAAGGKLSAEVVTDAGGKAVLTWRKEIRSYEVKKGTDCLTSDCWYRVAGVNNQKPETAHRNLTLLTDRSLYRPGQTVYIKGIAYTQYADSAHVLQGADYELALLDANRKEIATRQVRTNEFGSFATEFMLPAACLNGVFSVRTKNPQSSVTFRVEEYKRPTFEINFTPVSAAYRLGDTVVLKGNVKAFNGRTVQDMPLAYRVSRYNPWYSVRQTTESLVADTVSVDANGDFSIPLVLEAPKDETKTLGFRIEATMTDEAGETQSTAYTLQASDKPFCFDINLPQYICKEDSLDFTFSVTNMAGVPQQTTGIYKLYSNGESVYRSPFAANRLKDCSAWKKLLSGEYQLKFSVCDSLGHKGEYESPKFVLFSKDEKRPPVFTELFYYKENEEFDTQHPAAFLFGTSFKDAYVMMDVFCDRKRIESRTMQLNDTIVRMGFPYRETYGEGITLLFSFVKDGKVQSRQVYLKKRQPDRTLSMKWQVFRDRLQPGQEEEWRLVIRTPQGTPAAAEMLATMYDASLDKLWKRNQFLRVYYPNRLYSVSWSANRVSSLVFLPSFPRKWWRVPAWTFDYFYSPFAVMEGFDGGIRTRTLMASAKASNNAVADYTAVEVTEDAAVGESDETPSEEAEALQPAEGLRTNFAETAFFYPQLRTDAEGEIAFSFTMPQNLTRWNFRGYSHTQEMLTGRLDASVVTAKEFMLTPNMPRYIRVGDETEIAATIANLTEKAVRGTVTFTLFDPMTEKMISTQRRKFAVEAGRNTSVTFPFSVSDKYSLAGVRMVADGGTFSDGEQHLLPVLSNKEYVTETLAMPIRGNQARTFSLDSLFNRNSRTATERRLTVEFTGNPAWYAVQALPSLSQPTNENAVSWATAWYANTLAGYIAGSQPRIKAVFDSWQQSGASRETFLSQLEKNQEVKNILLDESPWVMQATTEAEQRQRIATLFDLNQLNSRNLTAFTRLKELQGEDGGWSWYKGMPASRYMTDYIAGLLVRIPLLTKSEVPSEVAAMKQKAFGYLHRQALEEYRNLRKAEKGGAKNLSLSYAALRYLYIIGISGEKVPAANETAYRYFLSKVKDNLTDGNMSRKALSAIILYKAGRTEEAEEFVASIKEHLVQTDERGTYFAFRESPYTWGMQPVSAHVNAMEALQTVGGNEALVEEMKVWLLKQKQVTAWNSPVTTADAVYALLCQGNDLLENRGDVRITIGKKSLETSSSDVQGTGYIKQTFTQGSPELKAKSITVAKQDAGIAWGAVYAQYLSPLSDVKQQGNELNVEKKLYVERLAADGSKSLLPITNETALAVGDKVISRLTIRLDRAMDFVQLKDGRAACLEPIGTLSGYRWNGSFGCYTEVEDAAANFFFEHLGKGVYVLEHAYRIARSGSYEGGIATIQCAYAPEFAVHSNNYRLRIIN